jgi:hypothetical protein
MLEVARRDTASVIKVKDVGTRSDDDNGDVRR